MNKFAKYHSDYGMEVIEFTRKHGAAKAIFDFLVRHMKANNSVIVSIEALAEIMDMSISNVNKSIRKLKDNNLIFVTKSGTSSVYHINSNIATKVSEGRYMHYELTAKVVLSESEMQKAVSRMKWVESTQKNEINPRGEK